MRDYVSFLCLTGETHYCDPASFVYMGAQINPNTWANVLWLIAISQDRCFLGSQITFYYHQIWVNNKRNNSILWMCYIILRMLYYYKRKDTVTKIAAIEWWAALPMALPQSCAEPSMLSFQRLCHTCASLSIWPNKQKYEWIEWIFLFRHRWQICRHFL